MPTETDTPETDVETPDAIAQPEPTDTDAPPSAETENTDTGDSKMVPYSRFAEVNKRMRDLEAQVAQFQEAEERRKEEARVRAGEHEKVIESQRQKLHDLKAQVKALETARAEQDAVLEAYLYNELKSVPQRLMVLVDGDTPVQKLRSLNKLREAGVLTDKRKAPDINGSSDNAGDAKPRTGGPDVEDLRRRFRI